MPHLNLQSLKLRDYRCFEAIDIDFHPQLTVLVASNGAGKTSILDAIAVAFGPYIGAFDEAVGKHFEPSDIRQFQVRKTAAHEMEYAPKGVRLEAKGFIPDGLMDSLSDDNSPETWRRALSSPTKAKTTIKDAKELIDYGKRMQEAVRTPGNDVLLPLIAYYGTGRLWQQKKLTAGKKIERTSRTIGYTDCLDPASSYKSFVEWFRYWNLNAKDLQLKEQAQTPAFVEFSGYIDSVKGAVDACLAPSGWEGLEYSFKLDTLVAHHPRHGELPVELLSDGIRNMIGMVADIAFRATKLNGQLGAQAASQTPGIVLIDEVDMHLHPEWQQVVLQNLVKAFPAMQFVVTTHSPQVLSTVKRENIRVIGLDSNGKTVAVSPLARTYGEPSSDVMHSVMMVDPQPPVAEKPDLQKLTEWVDQGRYHEQQALDLMQRLTEALGDQHPQLQRLQRSIQRQEAMKR
ncbi:AAA family ATPase [Burkholderia multivorans]|uniref:AAA family ATPase n=1 Tax=Burkholderia multivorans TaxID=87883 RepID=UPI001C2269B0|nr:AAA family ATPase [Burkholderia multivorans]MBU9420503.1 AAA family ATPase [Burkholderia multivorans]